MITSWELYWITRLDGILNASIGVAVLGFVVALFSSLVLFIEEKEKARPWIKRGFITGFLFGAIAVLIPSSKEMAAILVLPKIANSQLIQQKIPQEAAELYTMAKEWMKEKVERKESK